MIWSKSGVSLFTFSWLLAVVFTRSINADKAAASLKHIANVSYAETSRPSDATSLFSPRMDFDQWKPLTGRGDPLRNDPTYDYEPPVLKKVHYWADDSRLEREHFPERKSEVLMLGVSSRRPSVVTRHPVSPPMRQRRPSLPKYEDYAYKLSEKYPMTILVPPPIPPRGHKPTLFILNEEQSSIRNKDKETTSPITVGTSTEQEYLTSQYAVQEANLIYQSSTSHYGSTEANHTKTLADKAVSSEYAGWGPTTSINDFDYINETQNLIPNDNFVILNHPYSYYKPMLSEAPPPPQITPSPIISFLPTILPPLPTTTDTMMFSSVSKQTSQTLTEPTTEDSVSNIKSSTENENTNDISTTIQSYAGYANKVNDNMINMLSPMMTMPLVDGPERPEDHLYAHASENLHVFQETEAPINVEAMKTMQPPPPSKSTESSVLPFIKQPIHVNSFMNSISNRKPSMHTFDPYLHLRHTTPPPTQTAPSENNEKSKVTTELPTIPMYLIIQGHSKVKTYGSKPKTLNDIEKEGLSNQISNLNETSQVKHLHVTKDKFTKKLDKTDFRRSSRAHNLKSLVENGHGSIEIQETNIGIKYDVSDGSDVPIEVYRKGIVESDENGYAPSLNKNTKVKRSKRQLENIIPIDEDTLEEYVYNFLKKKRNDKGITGLIAQAVTSEALDDIDEDDDDQEDDDDEEER